MTAPAISIRLLALGHRAYRTVCLTPGHGALIYAPQSYPGGPARVGLHPGGTLIPAL
jgi:hypothetical protein